MHYLNSITLPPKLRSILLLPILPTHYDRYEPAVNEQPPETEYEMVSSDSDVRIRGAYSAFSNRPTGGGGGGGVVQALIRRPIHPEGSSYTCRGQIVSDGHVGKTLTEIGDKIVEQCHNNGLKDVTVFIRFSRGVVEYYITDHVAHTVVWANGDRPSSLAEEEETKIRNMLSEEYYAHMESFPGARPVTPTEIQGLINVLGGLAADSNTSDGSTSPFSGAQIEEFLNILKSFKSDPDEFQTFTVARLWTMIWHARMVNNFGSPNACLDRFTELSNNPPGFTGRKKAVANCSFGIAYNHLLRCSRSWSGRVAYVTEWNDFKRKNEKDWGQVMHLGCVLLVASLLTNRQQTVGLLRLLPTSLAASSAANGYYLTIESQNLGDKAADASNYFQKWEVPEYDMQRLALRNATPQTLLIWAFIAFLCVTSTDWTVGGG